MLSGVNLWQRYSYTSALQSTLDCHYSCFPPLRSLDLCGLHLNASLKILCGFIFSQYARLQAPSKQTKLHKYWIQSKCKFNKKGRAEKGENQRLHNSLSGFRYCRNVCGMYIKNAENSIFLQKSMCCRSPPLTQVQNFNRAFVVGAGQKKKSNNSRLKIWHLVEEWCSP